MPVKQDQNDSSKIDDLSKEQKAWIELEGMNDFVMQFGSGSMPYKLRLYDLYRYFVNPYIDVNMFNIRRASQYMTNRHGVVKEVLRLIKTLPSLNGHLYWWGTGKSDIKKVQKYEQKIEDYLYQLDVKNFVRDGLYQCAELGTIVACNRGNFVQFLDVDKLRINRKRNGKWVVEFDLTNIRDMSGTSVDSDRMAMINSLPDEITEQTYKKFLTGGQRYVELKNCDVIAIDAYSQFPWGLPYTFGAWEAILQKEIMDRVERSTADRLIKQILILTSKTFDKEGNKPVPAPLIKKAANDTKRLLEKKDSIQSYHYKEDDDHAGTAILNLLDYFDLKPLEVNTTLFKKDLYDKISDDIFMNLGVSPGFIYGGGSAGNFATAQFNGQKLVQYIYSLLERFERVITSYIQPFLPKDLSCRFQFDRSTFMDQSAKITNDQWLYTQMGISKPILEDLSGLPYNYLLSQAEIEKNDLHVDDILNPPQNPFTQSANSDPTNKGGRPQIDNPTNQNTIRSKENDGNSMPSPSDNK